MATHPDKPAHTVLAPVHARRPLPPNYIGADPYDMVGKVLRRVRRSSRHPSVTLEFSDNTSFQILVDGYDPMYPGVPKELEIDYELRALSNSDAPFDLPVIGCTLITLLDKAFERKLDDDARELRWDQKHLGIAFKFAEEAPRWRSTVTSISKNPGAPGRIHDATINTSLVPGVSRCREVPSSCDIPAASS
ncbi:hypothetical protein LshimejAT787_0406800 [Lyophyllum shimeji]|uniref:Uncharacterized protein n=1 Tax=Lyophyllum shimeji TaxID=47721 RepID=A0A9P3UK36_LYOSH|nr:hypothetical protein LshimejAT787_0406800 [Lyophyllum shimeji]